MTARAVALGAGLALLFTAIFVLRASEKMVDFEVYARAGARAAAAEPLYPESDGHYQHKYLPAFAIAAIPAALLPLPVAKAIWFALSALTLCALVALSLRLLVVRHRPAWILVAATTVVMAKFYGHELVLGQANVLLATLLVAAVHLVRGGFSGFGGLVIAAAVVVKPYAVIFAPWLIARGDIRALATMAAGVTAALLLPIVQYGPGGTIALHAAWWDTVTSSTPGNLLNADNVSLAGMSAKWLGIGAAATTLAITLGVVLVAAAAAVLAMRKQVPAADGLDTALLLLLIPLLSPQGWDYLLLLATPAVMLLVNHDRDLPAGLRLATIVALALIAFSLYDVMGRRAYRLFMDLSIITVCGLVLAAALAGLRLRRAA